MAERAGKTLLVTGRLAAPSLRGVVEGLNSMSRTSGVSLAICELPISVAALMTPLWIARQVEKAEGMAWKRIGAPDRIVIPGRVSGDLREIEDTLGVPVERGPNELWDIPDWLGLSGAQAPSCGEDWGFKIIAEITDAWRMTPEAILGRARTLRRDGAWCVDLGGCPDAGIPDVEAKIRILKADGVMVSVDTFHRETLIRAAADVDLILSVNSSNIDLLGLIKCPVVVVPDYEGDESDHLASLEANAAAAAAAGVTAIADPILSPPLTGFVPSLSRFSKYRSMHPEALMMMGTGNVTELMETDSAGVNALLAACICEMKIDYVLTTEVAHWTKGTVSELSTACGIMGRALSRKTSPKGISQALRELKGSPPRYGEDALREMQMSVTDANWRIFVTDEAVCAFNSERFLRSHDIAAIYSEMGIEEPSHSFYIGRELQKAAIALRLRRDYTQDDELRWGALP